MNALDSSYIWGVNPTNRDNLNPQQQAGLGSLMPQGGMGLDLMPSPPPLNPMGNLPTPQFKDPNAFAFEPKAAGHPEFLFNPTRLPGQANYTQAPSPSEYKGQGAPYFDPNYPAESMVALKQWLQPQLSAGTDEAMHSRGIYSSGLKGLTQDSAQNYLNTIAPMNQKQALGMDIERLYGPSIYNSLELGSQYGGTNGGIGFGQPGSRMGAFNDPQPPSLPPGLPISGNGSHGGVNAAFVQNPNAGNPGQPGFGLVDFTNHDAVKGPGFYETPGYWYDPANMPDASQMPWLANSLPSQTSQTSRTSP